MTPAANQFQPSKIIPAGSLGRRRSPVGSYTYLYETVQEQVRMLTLPPYALGPTDPDHPQQEEPTLPGLLVRSIYAPVTLQTPRCWRSWSCASSTARRHGSVRCR